MNAFVTGSRAYGTPTEDSDVDLCVCVSLEDGVKLEDLASSVRGSASSLYRSIYFGRLNLIRLDPQHFDAWKKANDRLIAEKPVTKERAIEVIDEERAAAGLDDFYWHVAADALEEMGFSKQAAALRAWRPLKEAVA